MDIKGKIYKVFPIVKGTRQDGTEWSRQDFIVEFFEHETDRYADRVMLNIMNERVKECDLHEGDEVTVGIGHSVREYKGRWYNEIRCYKVLTTAYAPQISPAVETSAPQPSVAPQGEKDPFSKPDIFDDDLPY